jgi:hypothetical protein
MKIIVKQTVMKEFVETYEIELTPEDVEYLREQYDSPDEIQADVWTDLDYELVDPVRTEPGDGWEELDYECRWKRGSLTELKQQWAKEAVE